MVRAAAGSCVKVGRSCGLSSCRAAWLASGVVADRAVSQGTGCVSCCTGWGASWRQNCQMGQVVGGGSQTSGAQAALVSLSQKIWTATGQEGSQARGLARTWTCIYRPGDFNLLARELITAQPTSVVRSKKFLFPHILVMKLLSQFLDNFCSYLDPAVKRSCHQMCRFE